MARVFALLCLVFVACGEPVIPTAGESPPMAAWSVAMPTVELRPSTDLNVPNVWTCEPFEFPQVYWNKINDDDDDTYVFQPGLEGFLRDDLNVGFTDAPADLVRATRLRLRIRRSYDFDPLEIFDNFRIRYHVDTSLSFNAIDTGVLLYPPVVISTDWEEYAADVDMLRSELNTINLWATVTGPLGEAIGTVDFRIYEVVLLVDYQAARRGSANKFNREVYSHVPRF